MHRHYTTHRNGGDNDRHGLPQLTGSIEEIEAGMQAGCPVCDGRGWTWEADPTDPDGGGLPCPCPLAGQFPTLHTDGRTI